MQHLNPEEQARILADLLSSNGEAPAVNLADYAAEQFDPGWRRMAVKLAQAGFKGRDEILPTLPPEALFDLWPAAPDAASGPIPQANWAIMADHLGPLQWAWRPWLPQGMLAMVAAQSEMGKSILCLRIAACYLRGDPWPDGTPFTTPQGDVLWCEAESGQAVNLDRAKKWGLPLERIHTPFTDPLADVILEDDEHQRAMMAIACQPEIRLIVVDSLSGANDRRDENSPEMLRVIKWLAELAKISAKPVLLTHHLRKRGLLDDNTVSLDRVRGSSAIVQLSRVVWALDRPDPNATAIRLSVIKNNLAPKPDPIGVTITEQGLIFDSDAPGPPKVESQESKAADLLLALLRKAPRRVTELQEELEGAGLSFVTAKRAKSKLGIISARKHDDKTGQDYWIWSLPLIDKDDLDEEMDL